MSLRQNNSSVSSVSEICKSCFSVTELVQNHLLAHQLIHLCMLVVHSSPHIEVGYLYCHEKEMSCEFNHAARFAVPCSVSEKSNYKVGMFDDHKCFLRPKIQILNAGGVNKK